MSNPNPPQPHPDRLTPFAGKPIVVGVIPGQPALVALTAASLAEATGASGLHFGYADPARFTVDEFPDGHVRHEPVDPDDSDDEWQATEKLLTAQVRKALQGSAIAWQLHYLAGRPDRALTHLARAIDAAAFVVGARVGHSHLREFVRGSVSLGLSHHQHRPVMVVPLEVVDWKGRTPWS